MSETQVDYKKKMQLYEALGARQFKKIVMAVEKGKWKVLKKVSPNFLKHYEKYCTNICNKKLSKESEPSKQRNIIMATRESILLARKEFNNEENRNYHMNIKRPTEMLKYLKWNKNVHTQGLVKNAIICLIANGFIISGIATPVAISVIAAELVSGLINWQCINLQNYNICRLEQRKDTLKKLEERRNYESASKYSKANEVISRAYEETKEDTRIPTPAEVVDRIENIEQLNQIKMMLLNAKKHQQSVEGKRLVKGR